MDSVMNRRTKLLAALSGAALAVSAAYAQDPKDVPQKTGVTPNDLVVRGVDGAENLEFIVIDVKYEPGGIWTRYSCARPGCGPPPRRR